MGGQQPRYRDAWERFWGTLSGESGEILWDVEPARAAGMDLMRFKESMDSRLPLIDFGCGNGTQTRFLAEHFARVVGVDVAPAALELARNTNQAPNVSFQALDILDAAEAQRLHDQLGDANIYMRGVLQQILPQDRAVAVQSLAILMGERGVLYCAEYPPSAKTYYGKIIAEYGPPAGFQRVLDHGITPGGLEEEELRELFPPERFEWLGFGPSVMNTVHQLPNGEFAAPPAFYLLLRRRSISL